MEFIIIICALSFVVVVYTLRKYLLFRFGIVVEGKVVKVKYEVVRIKNRVPTARITYRYVVGKETYEHTENSDEIRHMFKMHCMEGEVIKVRVQKKNHEKATVINVNKYLFPAVLMGVLFLISTTAFVLLV